MTPAVDRRIHGERTGHVVGARRLNCPTASERARDSILYIADRVAQFVVPLSRALHVWQLRQRREECQPRCFALFTGTHRLRGPEDVARYAALINTADPLDFGPHRFRADTDRRVMYRYADEVHYAIGVYLLSLEPPRNPNPPPADLVARGEAVFRREKCGSCHPAPDYTTGELTPVDGFKPPFDHPNFADIRDRSIGTDPGLALKTRKGTGFYKIPSLRGLWYRPRLLHDASIVSLEELFDAARLSPEYEPKGWSPPGVTKRAVPGFESLTKLTPEEKTALIAFLRSL